MEFDELDRCQECPNCLLVDLMNWSRADIIRELKENNNCVICEKVTNKGVNRTKYELIRICLALKNKKTRRKQSGKEVNVYNEEEHLCNKNSFEDLL